jgi:spore coat-associated protein N
MARRRIRLGALVAISVLMLAMLIGGLYGWFDDTQYSNGNTFTAGTLDLEVSTTGTAVLSSYTVYDNASNPSDPGLDGYVVFDNITPGDSGTIEWTLTNQGNVDGILTLSASVGGNDNGVVEPEYTVPLNDVGGDGDLDDAMDVELLLDGNSLYTGNLDGLAGFLAGYAGETMLGDGGTVDHVFVLGWSVDGPTVGNEIQSDQATLSVTFVLNQA